jgi:Right handed beta helix region/FlgD Ig-like domain
MKIIILSLTFLMVICFSIFATEVFHGPVSGTWDLAGSPYLIQGEINLPANQSLTIEPGVEVIFQGCYRFIVNGRLTAVGTETDSIFFTSENQYTGWKGIRFINTTYNGQSSGMLNYCRLEYGKQQDNGTAETKGGGLLCLNSSNLQIQNSLFIENEARYGGAIAIINSSPNLQSVIIKNNFAQSDGGGIYISTTAHPQINNSQISNNKSICDGGGIFIGGLSNPEFENVNITENAAAMEYDCGGGGAVVWNAQAIFENCMFAENNSNHIGGALWIRADSQVELNNSIITRNSANDGAGICNNSSDLELSGTSIHRNTSYDSPSGIYSYNGNLVFDQNNRSSIFLNTVESNNYTGCEISIGSQDFVEVYLDTFTIAVPTQLYASPLANFTFDIQNHIFEPTANNLYVSSNGSNSNSGLTPTEPIKSIFQAVQMIQPDAQNPLIIFIEDGTYSPSNTEEVFPINLKSYLTIQGSSKWNTIIDAEKTKGILWLHSISEVSVNDLTIKNANEIDYAHGGGINCHATEFNLSNIAITECYAECSAGGIAISGSCVINLSGTSIFNNSSNGYAGGINCDWGDPIINFDPNNLCNIYLNSSYSGYEIYWEDTPINVIVDTFTVMNPNVTNVYPFSYFTFDINNAIYEPVAADLYVSPNGSNSNNGLSSGTPLKTIHRALQMIISNQTNPHTIHLAEGVYSPSSNGESFPIILNDFITLSGVSSETTILDAEETNRVIQISGDHVTLENFSVVNGHFHNGAGINIDGDDAHLTDLTIKNNETSAEYYSYGNSGGGVYINGDDAILENVIISDNMANAYGGGIYLSEPVFLSGVTIKDNTSLMYAGGGLYCGFYAAFFDDQNLCNIMNNQSYGLPSSGNDICFNYDSGLSEEMLVYVDTFTVQYPSNYYANPVDHIIFSIQNYYMPSLNSDVYVAPTGSNTNSGLSADDPFRSITYALQRVTSDSLNPRIINLAPGTYSPAINGESFPLGAESYLTFQGESKENTIIEGDETIGFIFCNEISDFTIADCSIRNFGLSSIYNSSYGAIFTSNSEINLRRLNLYHNGSYSGAALYAAASDCLVSDCYIYDNETHNGGAVFALNSNLTLLNNTICFNEAASNSGGIYYRSTNSQNEDHRAILVNQILWDNEPSQIYLRGTNTYTATMIIDHSDIQDGETGISTQYNFALEWLEGNIDTNPMFGEPENEYFMLQSESPCVNTGTAFFEWEDEIYLDMQPDEYIGNAPDIGAWESEFTGSENSNIPLVFGLGQNFPNPFNPETKIQFSIPINSKVELTVYNMRGQKVKQLVRDRLGAGQHSIVWNGRNENHKRSSSGIYFYKIKAKVNGKTKFSKTRKMMLLK